MHVWGFTKIPSSGSRQSPQLPGGLASGRCFNQGYMPFLGVACVQRPVASIQDRSEGPPQLQSAWHCSQLPHLPKPLTSTPLNVLSLKHPTINFLHAVLQLRVCFLTLGRGLPGVLKARPHSQLCQCLGEGAGLQMRKAASWGTGGTVLQQGGKSLLAICAFTFSRISL